MRYKILPHTADLRLKVYGKDLEELFRNAALGLANILYKDAEKKLKFARGANKISVEAPDENILLVSFLNEILAKSNVEKKVYPKVKILKISPKAVEASAAGISVDHFDEDVKAVSYHGAEIKSAKSGLESVLILDI